MPEDRQTEYLDYLDDSAAPPDVWAELDAQTQAWIERRYQERCAELAAQRKRWAEQVAKWAKVDAEAQAIMKEMGW